MLVQTVVAQEPPGVAGRFGTLDYRTAGSCSAAALSPDGMLVAVAGWQTIALTDLANGKRIGQFAEADVILGPDQKRIIGVEAAAAGQVQALPSPLLPVGILAPT